MAFEKQLNEALPVLHAPCRHLRSKGMYVTGELRIPNHGDEEGTDHCWCNISQHVLGPDQNQVDNETCAPGRGCYQSSG